MKTILISILLLFFAIHVFAESTGDTESVLKIINRISRELLEVNKQLSEQGVKILEQTEIIADQNEKIAKLENRIAEQDINIANQDTDIANQNVKIANQETIISHQNTNIAKQDATIANLRADTAMSDLGRVRLNANDEKSSNISFNDLYMQMNAINIALAENINISKSMSHCPVCQKNMDGMKNMLQNLTHTVAKSNSESWGNWIIDIIKNETAQCLDHCQDGWIRFRDNCYLFSMEKQNWETAMNHCRSLSSSLVNIVDAEEDNFLSTTLARIHCQDPNKGKTFYWTAGKKKEGTWLWDNTQEAVVYSNWAPNEPRQRPCIALWGQHNFAWDDIFCTDNRNFICKKIKRMKTFDTRR